MRKRASIIILLVLVITVAALFATAYIPRLPKSDSTYHIYAYNEQYIDSQFTPEDMVKKVEKATGVHNYTLVYNLCI